MRKNILGQIFILLALAIVFIYCHYGSIGHNPTSLTTGRKIMLNLMGVCTDTTIWGYILLVLSQARLKHFCHIIFFSLYAYSIANVIYYRFFSCYFDICLINEVQNLSGLKESILSQTCLPDIIFTLLCWFTYITGFYKLNSTLNIKRITFYTLCTLTILLCVPLFLRGISWKEKSIIDIVSSKNEEYHLARNDYAFKRGMTDLMLQDIISHHNTRELTNKETEILSLYSRPSSTLTEDKPNLIILIIAESLNTDAVNRICEEDTVMPNLRKAITQNSALYFPHMKSMVHQGQSSDGQFIYFTGLLPHSQKTTVTTFTANAMPGLGSIMKQNGYHTTMIIPTVRNFWRQDEMCDVYGIDSLLYLEEKNYLSFADDETVIDKAMILLNKIKKEPTFLTILTSTTHQPYGDFNKSLKSLQDKELGKEYLNYLERVNYLDYQLGRLFEYLKKADMWDSTLIIVSSDHKAPLNYTSTNTSDEIPFIIINSNIEKNSINTSRIIYQQDLYPTMLDLLQTKHKDYPLWRGIGYSVFTDYKEDVTNIVEQQQISNIILETDIFNKQKHHQFDIAH